MHPIATTSLLLCLVAAPSFASEPIPHRARVWGIEASAVQGGWSVLAQDHLDVIVTLVDEAKQSRTTTLLQNVVVMSRESIAGGPVMLNLLVIPEEVELLALARAVGTLTFVRRNQEDLDLMKQHGAIGLKQLMGR